MYYSEISMSLWIRELGMCSLRKPSEGESRMNLKEQLCFSKWLNLSLSTGIEMRHQETDRKTLV